MAHVARAEESRGDEELSEHLPHAYILPELLGAYNSTEGPYDQDEAVVSGLLGPLSCTGPEAAIEVLRLRYAAQCIYAQAPLGMLLALNPSRPLPCLQDSTVLQCYRAGMVPSANEEEALPSPFQPHIWALCCEARRKQRASRQSVAFVLQGESGAGKTEAAKHILLYFASAGKNDFKPVFLPSGRLSLRRGTDWEKTARAETLPRGQRALACATTLLEAFGSARTARNSSSSRFGRLLRLFLDDRDEVVTSEVSAFALERARAAPAAGAQKEGERGFHVFYEALAGVTAQQRSRCKLRENAEDYSFLRSFAASSATDASRTEDAEEWHSAVLPALAAAGVEGLALEKLLALLSAVLLCGEVNWAPPPGPSAVSANSAAAAARSTSPGVLRDLADLLGVDAGGLEAALGTDERYVAGSGVVRSARTPPQARAATLCVARALYEGVFEWVLGLANVGGREEQGKAGSWMGILDCCGFQASAAQGQALGLEGLLSNYCEERLQQFFLEAAVAVEQQICRDEEVPCCFLAFRDNSHVLEAIDCQEPQLGLGILPMLEEQSCLPQGLGSTAAFLERCKGRFRQHPAACFAERGDCGFVISHTREAVEYSADGFVEQNSEVMPLAVRRLLQASSLPLVRHMFGEAPAAELHSMGKGQVHSAGKVLLSLSAVVAALRQSEARFVKCLRAGEGEGEMDATLVAAQLRAMGVSEALQEGSGYAYRRPVPEFLEEFRSMMELLRDGDSPCFLLADGRRLGDSSGDLRLQAQGLLQAVGAPKGDGAHYVVGRTRVFMTAAMYRCCRCMSRRAAERLPLQRLERRQRRSRRARGLWRAAGWLLVALQEQRRRVLLSCAAVRLQRHARGLLGRREARRRRFRRDAGQAVAVIAGACRSHQARQLLLGCRLLGSAKTGPPTAIQAAVTLQELMLWERYDKAAKALQRHARLWLQRRREAAFRGRRGYLAAGETVSVTKSLNHHMAYSGRHLSPSPRPQHRLPANWFLLSPSSPGGCLTTTLASAATLSSIAPSEEAMSFLSPAKPKAEALSPAQEPSTPSREPHCSTFVVSEAMRVQESPSPSHASSAKALSARPAWRPAGDSPPPRSPKLAVPKQRPPSQRRRKPSPAPDGEKMLGTWTYGARGDCYCISRDQHGALRFEELHPSGRRMAALLRAEGGRLLGELSFTDGREPPLGTLRLAPASDYSSLVSNFKRAGEKDWGPDTVAAKGEEYASPSPRTRSPCSPPSSSPAVSRSLGATPQTPRPGRKAVAAATPTRSGGKDVMCQSPSSQLQAWLQEGRREVLSMYTSGALGGMPRGPSASLKRQPLEASPLREDWPRPPNGGAARQSSRPGSRQRRWTAPEEPHSRMP